MRIDAALGDARAAGIDRLDAQLLLAQVVGQSRAWVIAHGDDVLDGVQYAAWLRLKTRRCAGEPLAYLLGKIEFYGLELAVDRRVLIPRADTETLVDWAVALLRQHASGEPPPTVLDLGTGSGAIALALRASCPDAQVTAVDASGEALALAQDNARRLGLEVEFLAGDWWSAVAGRRFDLAVANPPYIAAGDAHLPALRHEPLAALVAGADGQDDLRAIIGGALAQLHPGGWLLLEHGHEQDAAVRALLGAAGFGEVQTRRDLAGRPRVSGGRSPAGSRPGAAGGQ